MDPTIHTKADMVGEGGLRRIDFSYWHKAAIRCDPCERRFSGAERTATFAPQRCRFGMWFLDISENQL
ncbi:MAG: hypothetical protein ACKVP3_16355 [Hyphomicrobiaceae bacterium]